jgi:NitT/TauT family transport system ATP-binding protein
VHVSREDVSARYESGTAAHPSGGIDLIGISRVFPGGTRAVDALTLSIGQGQLVSLVGPSGCGKSTILRVIAGLDTPSTGSIRFGASDRRPRTAYVFQDAHLLPWRTVLANVTLPLELEGVDRAARELAARGVLESVGLSDFTHRHPAELSGGMRMRVSLARALVTDPELLLLDEPFAALDEITRQSLDESLRALWKQRGMTTVFVTHSIAEATYLSQRVVVLSRRPARVVVDQAIDLPDHRPASLRAEVRFAAQTQSLFAALVEGQSR